MRTKCHCSIFGRNCEMIIYGTRNGCKKENVGFFLKEMLSKFGKTHVFVLTIN